MPSELMNTVVGKEVVLNPAASLQVSCIIGKLMDVFGFEFNFLRRLLIALLLSKGLTANRAILSPYFLIADSKNGNSVLQGSQATYQKSKITSCFPSATPTDDEFFRRYRSGKSLSSHFLRCIVHRCDLPRCAQRFF